jgi:exonuclease III
VNCYPEVVVYLKHLRDALVADKCTVQLAQRAAFARLVSSGWTDALREVHPDESMYTFWDYMRDAWSRDAGMRLDHLLLSETIAQRRVAAGVDRNVRGLSNASDHVPAWVEIRRLNLKPAPGVHAGVRARQVSCALPQSRRQEALHA